MESIKHCSFDFSKFSTQFSCAYRFSNQSNLLLTIVDFTSSDTSPLQTTCIWSHILHSWSKVLIGNNQIRSPHCRLWNLTLLFSFNLFLLVRRTETRKYLWLQTIGVKSAILVCFPQQNYVKDYFWGN